MLVMGQASNTATIGYHVPSPDGPGSKFTSSSPGHCSWNPAQGQREMASSRWMAPGPGNPSPRLAQLAAPAPITAQP